MKIIFKREFKTSIIGTKSIRLVDFKEKTYERTDLWYYLVLEVEVGVEAEMGLLLPNGSPRASDCAELCHQRRAGGGLALGTDRLDAFWEETTLEEILFFCDDISEPPNWAEARVEYRPGVWVVPCFREPFVLEGRVADGEAESRQAAAGRTSRIATVSRSELAAASDAPSEGRRRC